MYKLSSRAPGTVGNWIILATKEGLLISKAVAEVKAPEVEQMQAGPGKSAWPVPGCRGLGSEGSKVGLGSKGPGLLQ